MRYLTLHHQPITRELGLKEIEPAPFVQALKNIEEYFLFSKLKYAKSEHTFKDSCHP